ncbi:MAG: F0F1 ATP synthase subunit B [Lachnospiraceae bacterium]
MNGIYNLSVSIFNAQMTPRLFDLDLQLLADAVLIMLAVFLLFLLMSYFFFNPAREFLKKRQEKIKTELEEAKSSKNSADALKLDYEGKLKNIEKEAEDILSDARKKALANENKIIAEAKQEAVRIINHAREEAELEKKKMADDVKKEMVLVAAMMAEKVVAAAIDSSVQDALVEETLKEIGESTWLS